MIQKTEEINGLYVTAVEKRKVGGTWYRVHKNLPTASSKQWCWSLTSQARSMV